MHSTGRPEERGQRPPYTAPDLPLISLSAPVYINTTLIMPRVIKQGLV